MNNKYENHNNSDVSASDIENSNDVNHSLEIPGIEDELNLERLKQKVQALQAELLAAESKAASHWDLLLRAKAEEENVRKRFKIDLENAHKYGIEKFAKSMLNIIDSLELGINSAAKIPEDESASSVVKSLKDGMDLTLKLLLTNLEDFGIKMLDPVGEKFNPTQHEAISTQTQEGILPNNIITVVQKGFMINDRVLRPARVIVSK